MKNEKIDLSESLNEIISNSFTNPSKQVGTSINAVLEFFNNTFLYPIRKYNIYAEKKLEEFKEELTIKMQKIPKDKITEPSINILGPTLEALKYNLNEEYIKEMFTNLLLADIDKDKKDKINPAYIEIIRQLSSTDAQTISTIFALDDIGGYNLYEMKGYDKNDRNVYTQTKLYTIRVLNIHSPKFIPKAIFILDTTLENLKRLGIIETKLMFERVKDTYTSRLAEAYIEADILEDLEDTEYGADVHFLSFTKFGRNFIELCMNGEYKIYEGYVGTFETDKKHYTKKREKC